MSFRKNFRCTFSYLTRRRWHVRRLDVHQVVERVRLVGVRRRLAVVHETGRHRVERPLVRRVQVPAAAGQEEEEAGAEHEPPGTCPLHQARQQCVATLAQPEQRQLTSQRDGRQHD